MAANRLANYLLSVGIKKGDSVAIFIENRPELLISVLACSKVGAISAMLNTSQKGKVLAHSIDIAKPSFIISGEECYNAYEDIRTTSSINAGRHLFFRDASSSPIPKGWLDTEALICEFDTSNPLSTNLVHSDDPCFYIYTSGTTGLPKAVIFNHGRFMKASGSFGVAAVRLT